MAKPKVSEIAVMDMVDKQKPVVKDFLDRDAALNSFIKLHLPHIKNTITRVHCVYVAKDKRSSRHRVNYYSDIWIEGSYIPTTKIVHSCFIEVLSNLDDNTFKMKDITIGG